MMRIVRSQSWPTKSSSTWTTTHPHHHPAQTHLSHTSPILLSHYSLINQTDHQRQSQQLQNVHIYFNTNSTTLIYPTSATIGLHQELRQFLCSEECHLLKPYFHPLTLKSEIGLGTHFHTILQHPIPDIYLQTMLQICTLPNKSDAPEPYRLLQTLLNYLNSLQIRLLRPSDLLDRLYDLAACIPSVIEEICLLLHRFSAERQSSDNDLTKHAWTVFMESGASIQTPYFLRLLLQQQHRAPSSSLGSNLSHGPKLSVTMIISLLQSFMRHFTTEILEPLVHTISATRMLILEADHSNVVCPSEIQRCGASTSTSSGPYFNGASILLPQLPTQTHRVDKFIPSHVLYSLVYELFMHLGPESIERVGPACRQVLTSFKLSNNTASILASPSSTKEHGKPHEFTSHDHHLTGTATTPTIATWSQFEYEVMKLNQAEFHCATASKFI